ncbi:MAG: peptide chain release factor 1 (bRF-1) [Bacillota bacterium]|nr:MAG: peptide chain release factor 1 (bRF-1) [Bacillota bacterium]MBS3950831.1 peptide chain release factor 1 [Peptococcaceae bacterium]
MLEKLRLIKNRYELLTDLVSDPNVIARQNEWRAYIKEQASLTTLVNAFNRYEKTLQEHEQSKQALSGQNDPDYREMLELEVDELEEQIEKIEEEIKVLLLPKDPKDDKNVILEVRAGTGGNEAALFAADLFRMYTRYAERQGWKTEVMSASPSDLGGYREVIFMVEGKGAYSKLKFESGAHRVQRVPLTEASGRIHTSTATVAVLPEAEEVDIEIDQNDLRIDTFCSSGPGGQSVNTTYSAVRLTHIPSGVVVNMQDEKSQIKNREKAMRVLRARLFDLEQAKRDAEMSENRRGQVGTGDRSERIRTFNFSQSRVSDHRISFTTHRLEAILDGDLNELIDALTTADQMDKLQRA